MSVQSIGNTLSPQQILQLLQQQSLAAADSEAARTDETGAADPAGQNLPVDPAQGADSAALGAQVAPAKAALDPATIAALLQIQELQNKAAEDTLIFGPGRSTGDPLLDALAGNTPQAGQNTAPTSLLDALTALQTPAYQTPSFQTTGPQAAQISTLDAAQLQSMLAAMTGSAASGNAIAGLTQTIMAMLGSSDTAGAPAPTSAAE
jgi:hypothetical protein